MPHVLNPKDTFFFFCSLWMGAMGEGHPEAAYCYQLSAMKAYLKIKWYDKLVEAEAVEKMYRDIGKEVDADGWKVMVDLYRERCLQ